MDQKAEAANAFANYRFSPEEMRVIKECEAEAVFKRCIPFGFASGMGAYIAVQRGFLKANSKYGAVPKMIGFAVFGYIAGRFSYQSVCVEKLMRLPGSQFAELMRQYKRYGGSRNSWNDAITINTDPGVATALSLAPFQSFGDSEQQPDSLNLDTTRPEFGGFDEYTPSKEGTNNLDAELNIPSSKAGITYDELRERNRAEYARSQNAPYTPRPAPPPQDDFDQRPLNSRLRASREEAAAKNQYGDVWSK